MINKSIGIEIKTLSNLIKRSLMNKIKIDVVTSGHGFFLDYLFANRNKDIFQKDLEKEFSIRRCTATGILNRMEKNGLIKRIPCDSDQRQKKIILSNEGLTFHKKSSKKIDDFERKLEKVLTHDELNNFYNTIDKLKNYLLRNH